MPEILKIIADNPLLFETLKKHIEDEFSVFPSSTEGLSDEQLGQHTRARLTGLKAITEAFRKIEKLRTAEKRREGVNPAR